MKKRVCGVLAALLLCLVLLPGAAHTAYAEDYDEIVNYDITVQPNVDDGSLSFTVAFDWKALEELPYGQELKIGVPNGSIRDKKALTDNIERLDFDNSYMYVYLTQKYKSGETFRFAYSWVQEYMYTLGEDGSVRYSYTPGWFDEARVDHMTVTWEHPAGVGGSGAWSADDGALWTADGMTLRGTDLPHGSQVHLEIQYPSWPTELSWENSSENLPDDWGGGGGYDDNDGDDVFAMMMVVFIVVVIFIVIVAAASRRDGYAGGFGTHYVYVNHLWYPAGPNGQPKPGSVGTPHKPKPPASSHSGGLGGGFGGGKHGGGGFGGSGFGGGSHCACASSCACACACACAGGGRAGCSAKNLYGAVRLDEKLSRKLEGETET